MTEKSEGTAVDRLRGKVLPRLVLRQKALRERLLSSWDEGRRWRWQGQMRWLLMTPGETLGD